LDLVIFLTMVIFFVFIIGLCVGSFLNVVILRAFSNESIAFPGSKCPSCQTPLKWHHNIPVFSYLLLKGKCAFCKDVISIQYPIIELVTGLLFVAIFIKEGLGFNTLFLWTFASLFVVLAVTDIKEKVVFDFHTYALVGAGLVYNLFNIGNLYPGQKIIELGSISFGVNNSIIASVLGVLAGIVIMELFARFGYLVAGKRAFGEGDTFIAAGLGAVFGLQHLIAVLLYGFIIQIVFTIPVFIKKLYTQKDYKTLGSFLVFFLMVIAYKGMEATGNSLGLIALLLFTLLLAGVGIYVCKRILGGLKSDENLTYLPFGPALVLGAIVMIFML